MLFGNYVHAISEKGRVAIPAKFRNDLGERFILSKGIGGCLFIFSEEGWNNFAEAISKLPAAESSELKRYFFCNAIELEPDSQGRVVIPLHFRNIANLTDQATFCGASTYVEVWNPSQWDIENNKVSDDRAKELFDNLYF